LSCYIHHLLYMIVNTIFPATALLQFSQVYTNIHI
jgi:hypothetical protein